MAVPLMMPSWTPKPVHACFGLLSSCENVVLSTSRHWCTVVTALAVLGQWPRRLVNFWYAHVWGLGRFGSLLACYLDRSFRAFLQRCGWTDISIHVLNMYVLLHMCICWQCRLKSSSAACVCWQCRLKSSLAVHSCVTFGYMQIFVKGCTVLSCIWHCFTYVQAKKRCRFSVLNALDLQFPVWVLMSNNSCKCEGTAYPIPCIIILASLMQAAFASSLLWSDLGEPGR